MTRGRPQEPPRGAANRSRVGRNLQKSKHDLVRGDNNERLLAAMGRLLSGSASKTNGKLTASNVALEAGLGRATLYRPGREKVLKEWERRLTDFHAAPNPKDPHELVRRLTDELARVRRDGNVRSSDLARRNEVLAQQVQHLTLELTVARDRIEQLMARQHQSNAGIFPITQARKPRR